MEISVSIDAVEDFVSNAYHGTSTTAAKNILTDGFRAGTNPALWLGVGVYFYENSLVDAYWYARRHHNLRHLQIAVLRARIYYGVSLDVTSPSAQRMLRAARDYLLTKQDTATLPQAIDYIVESRIERGQTPIHTVRANEPYIPKSTETDDYFQDSKLFHRGKRMVCVKEIGNIENPHIVPTPNPPRRWPK